MEQLEVGVVGEEVSKVRQYSVALNGQSVPVCQCLSDIINALNTYSGEENPTLFEGERAKPTQRNQMGDHFHHWQKRVRKEDGQMNEAGK
jgi:hypothetical protein